MPFIVVGGVVLDGVRFNTDPETYEPLTWAKRRSVHRALGGTVTIQDFGAFAKDNTVRLQSGNTRPLDELVVTQLHSRFRSRGLSYAFVDWLGNEYTVFILDFMPVPLIRGADSGGAIVSLHTYSMLLQVLSITKLLGFPYTGS